MLWVEDSYATVPLNLNTRHSACFLLLSFSSALNRTLVQIDSDILFSNTVTHVSHFEPNLPDSTMLSGSVNSWLSPRAMSRRSDCQVCRSQNRLFESTREDNNEYRPENIDGTVEELQNPIYSDQKQHQAVRGNESGWRRQKGKRGESGLF